MNDPSTTSGHPGVFRDARHILMIAEVTPGLPFPSISRDRAVFFYTGAANSTAARKAVAEAEAALSEALAVTFTPRRTKYGSAEHYILTATLRSGLKVELVALAQHIDGPPAPAEPELEAAAA